MVGTLILLLAVFHRLLETTQWGYNGARLMPSFALRSGLNYYVLPASGGPLYSSLYGPLGAVVYLPATLFSSPNAAVLAASALTILLCFAAAAFVQFGGLTGRPAAIDWLAALALGFLMTYLEPLKYSCFNVHVDGPGLALGAFAGGFLFPNRLTHRRWAMPASAFCAILAVFSKQVFIGVPLGLILYLWTTWGWRRVRGYLGWLALFGVLGGGLAAFAAGPENLYHCLIWVPAHHPWYPPSKMVSAIQAMRGFLRLAMPVPVILLACLFYWWTARRQAGGWEALRTCRAAPLILCGLVLLPFSIAARAKSGGDVNSLSFSLFFLAAGMSVLLADAARSDISSVRQIAAASLGAIAVALAISEAPLALDLPASFRRLSQAPQQVAWQYLQRHPGEAYFPWFPQSHYYAEHRFRHYAFGIIDRLLAGEPFSEAQFRAYVPSEPRIIGFWSDGTPRVDGFDLMRYLPEYDNQTTDPELPGWILYAK